MSVIFRPEGAESRGTARVVSATRSSNDIPNTPPKAIPPKAALRKNPRRLLFIRLIISFFEIIVQLLFAHWQLPGVMVQPVQEILFYLLRPLTVDLPRQVFFLPQPLMSELIAQF